MSLERIHDRLKQAGYSKDTIRMYTPAIRDFLQKFPTWKDASQNQLTAYFKTIRARYKPFTYQIYIWATVFWVERVWKRSDIDIYRYSISLPKKEPKYIDLDTFERIWRGVTDLRAKVIIILTYEYQLKIDQMCQVRTSDFDFTKGVFRVGKSIRPITSNCDRFVKRYIRDNQLRGALFITKHGLVARRRWFQYCLHKALQEAGLPLVGITQLQHSRPIHIGQKFNDISVLRAILACAYKNREGFLHAIQIHTRKHRGPVGLKRQLVRRK